MKKVIALVLVTLMAMSLFAGCFGSKDLGSDEDGKLRVGIQQSATISSYTDNDFTRWIEEQLGIEIEFVYYASSGTEACQQFALDCAAQKYEDMPDVVWGFHDMSNYTLGDLGEDGYVMDLTDYLNEEYFPNFMAAIAEVPEADRKTALEKGVNPDDGGYYGMPLIALEHIDNLANMVFINQEWLDELGLDMPTTADELYTVLVAFRDNDPNGNGKKDELPMVGNAASCNGIAAWVMNAFCYWDAANIYNVSNGQVWSPIYSEYFREGLKFLNKLYEEGLLAEMSLSGSSYTDFIAVNTPADNVAKAGIWIGHPSIYTDANTTILDQYTAMPSLQDASGVGVGGYTVFHKNAVKWVSWICEHSQRKNTAMRFLDLMYTDEAMTRMRMGEKGIFWDYGEEGLNVKGETTNIHIYDDSAFFSGNSTWGRNGNCIMNDANYTGVDGEYIPGSRSAEVQRLAGELWYNVCLDGRRPKEVAHALIYTSDDFDRRSQLYGAYFSYYAEALTLFITGKNDINDDATWNAYKAQLDKLGRAELEGIAQRAYNREIGK